MQLIFLYLNVNLGIAYGAKVDLNLRLTRVAFVAK